MATPKSPFYEVFINYERKESILYSTEFPITKAM